MTAASVRVASFSSEAGPRRASSVAASRVPPQVRKSFRVVAVLAAGRIEPGGLDTGARIRGDPDFAPGGRDDELGDPLELLLVTDLPPGRIDVAKSLTPESSPPSPTSHARRVPVARRGSNRAERDLAAVVADAAEEHEDEQDDE